MSSDSLLVLFVAGVWIGSIGLVVYLFYALQKEYSEEKKQEIKLKDDQISKDVDSSNLSDIVDSDNNEQDGKG